MCSLYLEVNIGCRKLAEKCDLFTGDWIPNPSGPIYTNQSCRSIESHQNCINNGRPDTGYLYWRWNPRECELPLFDPERFLDMMRHKQWGVIGDSISRNHVQSLLCMLSTVIDKIIIAYWSVGFGLLNKKLSWSWPRYFVFQITYVTCVVYLSFLTLL